MNAKRTKIMNNEIKVGDKVRVSKDAPRMYIGGMANAFTLNDSNVTAVEDDNANLRISLPHFGGNLTIPTKYLIKVEDEAKEPKFNVGDKVVVHYSTGDKIGRIQEVLYDGCYDVDYGGGCTGHHIIESRLYPYSEPAAPTIKVGDFVRVLENLHEPFCLDVERHLEITNIPPHAVSQKEWKVISVEMRRDCAGCIYTLKHDDSFIYNIPEDCVELVQPKEQTEKKPNIGSIKIPVEVDLTDSYWDTYTADLARDLALKVANKYNDPKEAADYAVSVAKAVVENLKKK